MGGKKKTKAYVPEAFEYFRKCLKKVRQPNNGEQCLSKFQVDIEGLQRAVQALPKIDRERIEKYWGLTGGPNHSKKLVRLDVKDVAFNEMSKMAILSLRKLFTLEYLIMYDPNVNALINKASRKINKSGITISDHESVKYLMAFFVYADNGPKMSFEENPMEIDEKLNGTFLFDEYEVLEQMCQELKCYPDHSINLKLLISFFEMMNFQDMLAIKKSMGIEIANHLKNVQAIKNNVGIETIKDFNPEDVEIIRSVSSIREFKERVFPCGAWDVTSALILGNIDGNVEMNDFMEKLDTIRKDWTKITDFKTGQKNLRVFNGIRTLDIYNIGGLEFTDAYEVMFLYLERNLIASAS